MDTRDARPTSGGRRSAFRRTLPVAALVCALQSGPTEAAGTLSAGPMLGSVELRTARIWAQTEDDASVQLRYYPAGQPELARLTEPIRTGDAEEHTATFVLDPLEPGTTYEYEVYVDGHLDSRPEGYRLTTQPLWDFRTDPPAFRALFGSCAYFNEPAYDRPGTPYGSDFEIFATLAAEEADLMIWLGDNVYTREADFFSPEGLARRYRHDRAFPGLQPFLAAMPHYATWDDHDYGPNSSDRFYPFKQASLDLFRLYWPAPVYGTPDAAGVFQRIRWADTEFFLCDNRWYRMPDTWPNGPEKTMLGPEQMEWLKGGLLGSRAPFKFVVVGSQVLNPNTRYDTMTKYRDELEDLIGFIRDQRIDGVIFLSGDRHHTELIRIEHEGMYPLYDFTCSPLTAGASRRKPSDDEFENPVRVPGTFVHGEHSYGVLEVSGARRERVLTMRAFSTSGEERWSHTVAAKDLSFPRGQR